MLLTTIVVVAMLIAIILPSLIADGPRIGMARYFIIPSVCGSQSDIAGQ